MKRSLVAVLYSGASLTAAFSLVNSPPSWRARSATRRVVQHTTTTTTVRRPVASEGDDVASRALEDDQVVATTTTDSATCPCGSGLAYDECCGPLHTDDAVRAAAEPRQILRARYSAYVEKLPDFIIDTTHWSNEEYLDDIDEWRARILDFARSATFVSLSVIDSEKVHDDKELVTWCARMKVLDGIVSDRLVETKEFIERSVFLREDDGRFYYAKGDPEFDPRIVTVDGPLQGGPRGRPKSVRGPARKRAASSSRSRARARK